MFLKLMMKGAQSNKCLCIAGSNKSS